jgi:hypothetical protein
MFIPGSMKGKHTNLVNYTHAQLLITLARIVFVDPEMAVKISARAREPLSPVCHFQFSKSDFVSKDLFPISFQ